uniref:Focal adhesion kinase 1 n=1 Tax=Steinernema glaseri TaxID=37863 RepID=A0A1I8A143_9BILA
MINFSTAASTTPVTVANLSLRNEPRINSIPCLKNLFLNVSLLTTYYKLTSVRNQSKSLSLDDGEGGWRTATDPDKQQSGRHWRKAAPESQSVNYTSKKPLPIYGRTACSPNGSREDERAIAYGFNMPCISPEMTTYNETINQETGERVPTADVKGMMGAKGLKPQLVTDKDVHMLIKTSTESVIS